MTVPAREPLHLVPDPRSPQAESEQHPRVAVWAPYPAMRAGLRALLAEMGIETTEDDGGADVVVADAGDTPPADILGELREQHGQPAAILLLVPDVGAVDALDTESDAPAGMLLRDVSGAELAAAVNAVASGLTVLDPSVAARMMGTRQAPRVDVEPLEESLTERELEVLRELALGLPNKTIALRLGISEHTVKYHVGEILAKLGAASRTEAVMQGARRGLLPL